jgi:hypothetical protein
MIRRRAKAAESRRACKLMASFSKSGVFSSKHFQTKLWPF